MTTTKQDYLEASGAALEEMAARIEGLLEEKRAVHEIVLGELTLTVAPRHVRDVMRILRDDQQLQFVCLIDLCGVDWPARDPRFDTVYHLLSPRQNARVRVKVPVGENQSVPSVTDIFPAAEWFERETYDFYGIMFSGHPDLRRLLTDYGFDGYPLRKDFPLTGYSEVRYDDERKQVVYEPVELAQEFRRFDFLSPWEGMDHVLPGDEKSRAE